MSEQVAEMKTLARNTTIAKARGPQALAVQLRITSPYAIIAA